MDLKEKLRVMYHIRKDALNNPLDILSNIGRVMYTIEKDLLKEILKKEGVELDE